MIYAIILLALCMASCNLRSTYPTLGAIAGGGVGSLGGPGAAALGAGIGAISGEALKNKDALIEAEETIEALSHGDVSALVAQGMEEHKTGFDAFTSYIKNILIGAAVFLAATSPFQSSLQKELHRVAPKAKQLRIKLAHHL